jgi:hypothetical protein
VVQRSEQVRRVLELGRRRPSGSATATWVPSTWCWGGCATAGAGEVGPELLLLGVVTDIRTPWPRCMNNRWRRQLHASVGLPKGYRGAAGPLLGSLGVSLDELAGVYWPSFGLGCRRRGA